MHDPDRPDEAAIRYGRFSYHIDEDRWEWSDQLARLHGYDSADAVVPTSDLLLMHKHPDDRDRVATLIEQVRHAGEPFSSQHRIVDRHGTVIPVIVIADSLHDVDGRRQGTFGFYVTGSPNGDSRSDDLGQGRRATMDVDEMVRRRATIERVKGALMLVYRLDAQQAFDLLVWRSQESNVKLYTLAAAIERRIADIDLSSRARANVDRILLNAHEDVLD
ncbi:ANTAR domain-containing protein [Gordonia humi]|uniref:PAS domain S-box-containing protein n=1 Tax=Gordonia humi TaxID=686429 RepID=A0A840EXD9_9ACTN|nr:PAS domain S-box-containing protein [Gordonia humi]